MLVDVMKLLQQLWQASCCGDMTILKKAIKILEYTKDIICGVREMS